MDYEEEVFICVFIFISEVKLTNLILMSI